MSQSAANKTNIYFKKHDSVKVYFIAPVKLMHHEELYIMLKQMSQNCKL